MPLLILSNLQFQFTRQIPLNSFDGKNYRMEMKWAKEQLALAVAYTASVELTFVSPNKIDLKISEANAIPAIKKLENSLKVDNLTENKNLDLELGLALFFRMHESRGIGSQFQ